MFDEFDIIELDLLKYLLGIEVAQSQERVSQHKYTLDLLKETMNLACKPQTCVLSLITNLVIIIAMLVWIKETFKD